MNDSIYNNLRRHALLEAVHLVEIAPDAFKHLGHEDLGNEVLLLAQRIHDWLEPGMPAPTVVPVAVAEGVSAS